MSRRRSGWRRALRAWSADVRVVLPAWLAARAIVLAALVAVHVWSDRFRGAGDPEPEALRHGLLAWDGSWYRDIAAHGYDGVAREGLRFFPLFPLLGRAVAAPFGGGVRATGIALVVIANVASLVATVLLLRAARAEVGGRGGDLPRRAVWLLCLAPPASFLVLAYAESLVMVCALVALGAVRRGRARWGVAAAAALAAGLVRPQGLLLAPALAWEAWGRDQRAKRGDGPAALTAVAAAPLGAAAYLFWVGRTDGDGWYPVTVHRDRFRGAMIDPVRSLARMVGDALDGDANRALHLAWAVALGWCVLVVAARLPGSWAVLAGGSWLVAVSSERVDSLERYVLAAFPVAVAAALVVGHPRLRRVEPVVLPLCAVGLAVYAVATFGDGYVP